MPELPEVQTIVDELRPLLVGRRFTGMEADWASMVSGSSIRDFATRLDGQTILRAGRRGKYLLFSLSGGDTLLIHLMMSGHLFTAPCSQPLDRHTHVRFSLDDGSELRFRDVRKLGRVYLAADSDGLLDHLGPEPLDLGFSLPCFRDLIIRRRGRVKSLLLNQRFVAGLGNIYADETLFAAGIHPQRRANTLTENETGRLYQSIRGILKSALAHQGTTLADSAYRRPDGRTGGYQTRLQVYGRRGAPCPLCGTPVERTVLGGRGTHFCPKCQS